MWLERILQHTEMKNPKVKISSFSLSEGGFRSGKKYWSNETLFKAAKGIKPYDLQLSALDLDVEVWKDSSDIAAYLFHINRTNNADLSYPIIQHPNGYIVDGWHRVCKAILMGNSTIKCVRLDKMPLPDRED